MDMGRAGIVAARDNAQDVIGVAPKATLYCVKVLNASGTGSDSDLIKGLDFVFANAAIVQPPIRVVNISFSRSGTVDDNPNLRAAVQRLYNAAITVVVSAGDDPYKEAKDWIPAAYPEVLAVASTTAKDGTSLCSKYKVLIKANTASEFTSDGAFVVLNSTVGRQGVTISAPGEDEEDITKGCTTNYVGILSTRLGGGTTRMSGTSMAAPHVAGVAARLVQKGIGTPESIRSALRSNALVGVAPYDAPYGSYSFDGEREGIAQATQ
jgi:subtilisin family serine protease